MSPTAPNLWTQSAMTSIEQPAPATITMVTHHLHPPRTAPIAHDSTQLVEQTALDGIPIAPNATRQDTGDQNAVVASHSNQRMHLCQEMHPQLGHSMGPDTPGRGGKTDIIDVGEDHSPQDEIAFYGIQANVTTVATAHATGNTKEHPHLMNCSLMQSTMVP